MVEGIIDNKTKLNLPFSLTKEDLNLLFPNSNPTLTLTIFLNVYSSEASKFITHQLFPAIKLLTEKGLSKATFGKSEHGDTLPWIVLEYIPLGNPSLGFTCKESLPECFTNKVHSCFWKILSKKESSESQRKFLGLSKAINYFNCYAGMKNTLTL